MQRSLGMSLIKWVGKIALLGVCLMAGVPAFAAPPEDPQTESAAKFPLPGDPPNSFRPVTWKALAPNILHDQKSMWTFPSQLAHGQHWKPTLGVTAALGLPILAANWIGGHPGLGLAELAIMVAFALFLLLAGSRSETIRGLRGDGRDERFAMIDLRATAFAGLTIIVTLIVSWMVAVARGQSGSPYDWLCAIGGLAYIAGVGYLRWRG